MLHSILALQLQTLQSTVSGKDHKNLTTLKNKEAQKLRVMNVETILEIRSNYLFF